jgi:hypothetical protein
MRLTEPKIKYKPIATEFRHDGFNYKQIAREGDYAIYEQSWKSSENVAYEVVRIRRHDGFMIAGKTVEPAEVYPRSDAWGTDGFTLHDKDAAFARLKSLEHAPEGHFRTNAIPASASEAQTRYHVP